MEKKSSVQCSFCGKDKNDSEILIAGISAHICNNCICNLFIILIIFKKTRMPRATCPMPAYL